MDYKKIKTRRGLDGITRYNAPKWPEYQNEVGVLGGLHHR